MSMYPLSTIPALTADDARRLSAALSQSDAALAELEHLLMAEQARGEAILEASLRLRGSEVAR